MNETEPDHTAVRVALWRALHVLLDPPPHVLDDTIGLALVAPDAAWRERRDMDPGFSRHMRASICARARFIEDLVIASGVGQYVLLGAGLDTFAQRRPDLGARLRVFEVDRAGTQAWKRRRLAELGHGEPAWLRFAPVDFEAGGSWRDAIAAVGFDAAAPAVVALVGVSMYLTRDALAATMREVAGLAAGSTLAMTFVVPPALIEDPRERHGLEIAMKGAAAGGTPFLSLLAPDDAVALARAAGFAEVAHVAPAELVARYFAGRSDGLGPGTGEHLIVATVR